MNDDAVIEAMARALPKLVYGWEWDDLRPGQQQYLRDLASAALRAALAEKAKCETCGGTGADVVATHPLGAKIGSGHPCKRCGGSGKAPSPTDEAVAGLRDLLAWDGVVIPVYNDEFLRASEVREHINLVLARLRVEVTPKEGT